MAVPIRLINPDNSLVQGTPFNAIAFNGIANTLDNYVELADASVTGSSNLTIPDTLANYYVVALSANISITLPSPTLPADGRFNLLVELTQDATGNRAVTWVAPAGMTIKWDESATAPVIASAGNLITTVLFSYRQGSTKILGGLAFKEVL